MDAPFTVPEIKPQADDHRARPFWSVMIPAYNPRPDYLRETLQCVLAQAPSAEQMQIEVVDDASPDGATAELVRRIAGDRVAVHCEPRNRGLAGIWNLCIERARGEWIHILHQDDLVLPGFYERLKAGAEASPPVGAAFCRQAFMDEDGHWFHMTNLERRQPGVLENWLERITIRQRIETASIAVRRSVYEEVGGFLPGLCYALDWEMWRRIASRFQVWYEPKILACYRLHGLSATARLNKAGKRVKDVVQSIDLASAYVPRDSAVQLTRLARREFALTELDEIEKYKCAGDFAGARALIRECLGVSRDYAVVRKSVRLHWWLFRHQLRSQFNGG